MMYTSGWPKNQKMCRNIVGRRRRPREEAGAEVAVGEEHRHRAREHRHHRDQQVRRDDHVHTKSGIFMSVMPGARMLRIVVMMLIEPMIDEAPRCGSRGSSCDGHALLDDKRRIERPAGARGAARHEERADEQERGRNQQPEAPVVHAREGMSAAPTCSGTSQFAKPTKAGMIAPNTITRPVNGGEGVEELGIEELQARLEKLEAMRSAIVPRGRT